MSRFYERDADSTNRGRQACLHHPSQLLSASRHCNNMCKPTQTSTTGTAIGQQGGFRLEGIHSLHLALSGTATLAILVGLLFYCFIKRKKSGCLGISNQPPSLPLTTPTAPPALQGPVPVPDLQAPMPNLQLNSHQQQLQNSIRVMIESEMARSRLSQRNPNQKNNMESATGSQQESVEFQLA